MNEISKELIINIPKKEPVKETILSKFFSFTLEVFAVLFWLYTLIKIFIYDIDTFVINKINPHLIWLISYKFFILISLFALIWSFAKTKNVIFGLLYIIFYPVIFVFWKMPFFFFKQKSWALIFAFINSILSFFKSIKYNFIASALFLVAFLSIIISENKILLILSCSVILCILTLAYIRTLIFVFKPSSIFQIYTYLVKKTPDFLVRNLTDKKITALQQQELNEAQLTKWRTDLQTLVLINHSLLFFAKKLKNYQDSKLNSISYVFNVFLLILFTILSFATLNYGLFKIEPLFYKLTTDASYFIFLFYSFHIFLLGSIAELNPIHVYSQLLSMIEQLFDLFIGLILVSLYFSVKNEKYKEELNKTIEEVESSGRDLENIVQTEYKMSLSQAIEEIGKLQGNLVKLIFWFSGHI